MTLPFVSVIIPTLNEEKFLENTLKSVKNQDYKGKIETIVADSYSKDKTIKIARKHANKVVQVENKSICAGRNAGLHVAGGGIIVFLDADTVLLPNSISSLVSAFKNNVVGVTCPVFPSDMKITNLVMYSFYNLNLALSIKAGSPFVAGVCCAYRKSALEKIGGFNESTRILEDFDLSKRISKLGKIVVTTKTIALTSVRRLERWGKLKSTKNYLKMYLNYLVNGKSYTRREYPAIR